MNLTTRTMMFSSEDEEGERQVSKKDSEERLEWEPLQPKVGLEGLDVQIIHSKMMKEKRLQTSKKLETSLLSMIKKCTNLKEQDQLLLPNLEGFEVQISSKMKRDPLQSCGQTPSLLSETVIMTNKPSSSVSNATAR